MNYVFIDDDKRIIFNRNYQSRWCIHYLARAGIILSLSNEKKDLIHFIDSQIVRMLMVDLKNKTCN